MKLEELRECSLSRWFPLFADITFPTLSVPIPPSVQAYLGSSDGLVLPDDLESCPETQEIISWMTEVDAAIGTLGGAAFPKLNWSSPKDARWVATGHTLKCTAAADVVLLLKSSEFVSHDLNVALSLCEDYAEGTEASFPFELNLRAWAEDAIEPGAELRLFLRQRRVQGLCQRNCETRFPALAEEAFDVSAAATLFVEDRILPKLLLDSAVLDLCFRKQSGAYAFRLLDVNVWSGVTDSLLWDWLELGDPGFAPSAPPALRTVDDDAMRTSSYDAYGLPIDVQMAESADVMRLISGMADGTNLTQDLGSAEELDDA